MMHYRYSIVVVASLNGRTRPGPLNNTTVHTSDLSSVTESHQLAYRGKQTGPPVISSDRDRTLIHVSTDIKNHSDNETLSVRAFDHYTHLSYPNKSDFSDIGG